MTLFPGKEESLKIPGPAGQLQAMLHFGISDGQFLSKHYLAIICHPHPVHGGTMDNKVVTTLMRVYRDLGINVLRFNFRGVGESDGVFDNAVGELDDLRAVIEWSQRRLPQTKLILAGFSFGSSIAAQVSYDVIDLLHLTLVAPPIERYPYARNNEFPCATCVVQGDKDERVLAGGVYEWVTGLQGSVTLLRYPDASHFFHGYLASIKMDLTQVLIHDLKDR